jgi:hypothetical protein
MTVPTTIYATLNGELWGVPIYSDASLPLPAEYVARIVADEIHMAAIDRYGAGGEFVQVSELAFEYRAAPVPGETC